ncbi:MAG: efflux RND transporter periplasmic adaptor subunit [Flavobacterium sp.]|nr:efflux RND transporter periplasmic adaptor subunit [Flavobacterium sp.]
MTKKLITWGIVLTIVAAAVFFYFATKKKQVPINFVTVTPQYGYIAKSVTATGSIQPVDTVSVGAQVSGVVQSIYADFNSVVKQGQLLAKIDPSIIQAQTEQATATLANAKSSLQLQQSSYDRQNQLYNLGAISKADYQIALNLFQSAKAAVNNASALLRVANKNLSYTNIYSPINGMVLNRNVSAGQTIASSFNAPTLFVIAKDLTKMQVRAAVDEADIGEVKTTQNASFTVDAFPDDIFKGSVQQILLHPSVSANVITYTTLINVDNLDLKLKPGMTASINIYTQEDSNVLLIPARALNFKPDTVLLKKYTLIRAGKNSTPTTSNNLVPVDAVTHTNSVYQTAHVWLKNGDTLTQRTITIGLNDDSYVRVINGLVLTDNVVTTIVAKGTKAPVEATQKSPFMPQFGGRKAAKK